MRANNIFFVAITSILFSCNDDEKVDCGNIPASYNGNVATIVNANCLSSGCHDSGSRNGDFTSYQGLKSVAVSGDLKRRVVDDKTMPPNNPLSQQQRDIIQCWIEGGAKEN